MMIYLNQAGTSWPKPRQVHEAIAASMAASPDAWASEIDANRRVVCEALGVSDPDRLLLTPGATSALAIALADHDWSPGDRVLISQMEHHALVRPAELLARHGVELTVLPRAEDGPLDLSVLESELARGRARIVAISAASNVTGETLPLRAVIEAAHRHGALALVDAAQWAGWAPLDPAELGADLAVFAGHKAPQGPQGIGGLYVAPHVRMMTPRATCEIGDRARGGDGAPACAPMPGYCDSGSLNRVALAGLAAGLRWMGEVSGRLDAARQLAACFADRLGTPDRVVVHGAQPIADRMPTVALTIAGHGPAELAAQLASAGIVVGAGFQCAPIAHEALGTAATGVLRVSFGPSNEMSDAERAADAVHELVD